MDTLSARPRLLKQANLSLIRRTIKYKGSATRAEIAKETQISSTTVRSLLSELLENGEIESIGFDVSSGGRKAERYQIRQDRYYCAAFCISAPVVHCLLVNIYGEILEDTQAEAPDGDYEAVIFPYLDSLMEHKDIKSIGIGVPGIVEGGSFWNLERVDGEPRINDIGDRLSQRYGIPVIMENDLNATAMGFARCYLKEFPGEDPDDINMAYLHFEKTCISAGFIAGGRIIRGSCNMAGELGLIPMEDGRSLNEWMAEAADDLSYTDLVIKLIVWICGILNPDYVALGGPALKEDCVGPVGDGLSAFLLRPMSTQILYSPDVRHDYLNGMAYLTASGIFDKVRFGLE